MHAWESIQETLEYIDKHYDEEINIEKLASIAHLSKFYYQRLFYRLVKKNVADYIKLRRLYYGIEKLKNGDDNILDIALSCGFSSHGHFSRVFKEVYHISPDEYRKGDYHLDCFAKPDLLLNYIIVDEGVPLIVNDMVLEIKNECIDADIIFKGNSQLSLISDIGQSKTNMLVELWNQLPEGDYQYGADILTLSDNPEYFDYFVGVESTDDVAKQTRTMPKGMYVVCTYEAENFDKLVTEALYKASQYLYETWLVNHQMIPESILIQKYFHPFEENCYIELWAKVKES